MSTDFLKAFNITFLNIFGCKRLTPARILLLLQKPKEVLKKSLLWYNKRHKTFCFVSHFLCMGKR